MLDLRRLRLLRELARRGTIAAVAQALAAALLPGLSGAAHHQGVVTQRLPRHPRRQIFTTVRRGSAAHPRIQAFTTALTASRPGPGRGIS